MLPLIYVYNDREKIEPTINVFSKQEGVLSTDIFRIIPEKRVLHIDQIKELIKQISITSPRKRLFVLYDLDLSGPPAQNSLLKTLEEKKDHDYFMIFVSQLELVLTTIRSRCNVIYIDANVKKEISLEMHEFVKILLGDSPINTLSSPLVMGMNIEKGVLFLDQLILAVYAHISSSQKKTAMFLKEILKTKSLLQSNNLNPQLAIDSLLLKLVSRG